MIIVTGTGRCGTAYMSRLLSSAGVECVHEGIFRLSNWARADEMVADLDALDFEANSSWLMAPFLDQFEGHTIVHLMRHPKPTIDSFRRIAFFNPRFQDSHWPYAQFAKEYLPEAWAYTTTKMRAGAFYVGWNRMIEDKAPDAIRFHVEDDPRLLLDRLDLEYEEEALYTKTDTNSCEGLIVSDVDLTQLWEPVKSDLATIAADYDYELTKLPAGCGTCRRDV